MKTMKKAIAMFLALTCVAAGTVCADGTAQSSAEEAVNAASAAERYDKVVIGIGTEITTLEPTVMSTGCRPIIGPNIYQTLFDMDDATKEIYNVLAEDYEMIDDLTYNIKLYDYIVDSRGNAITADDVIYSYRLGIDSGINTTVAGFVDSEGITALDDYTVQFNLKTPLSDVGDFIALFQGAWIFDQEEYEASPDGFSTDPVGTGPYILTSFTAGSSVTLEANDNYWQKDELCNQQDLRNVQSIRYDTITSSAQMVVALKSGLIDYADNIALEDAADFSEGGSFSDRYSLGIFQDSKFYDLLPNCSENSLVSDKNLRMALYYAVDSAALAGAIGIDASPMIDICNSNFEEYDPSYADEENYITVQDVELAKKYLEDSSYNGETLKMMVINSEATLNAAQILQIFWNAIGINTEFLIYDNATVKEYKDVNDIWDLCLEYRTGSNYVCAGLKNCFDRAAKHTAMWVDDDDRLYEVFSAVLAAATHSPETWRAFHDYVVETGYMYPLYNVYNYGVYSNDITSICKTYKKYILPGACTYVAK